MKLILTYALLFLALYASAQDQEIIWGERSKADANTNFKYIGKNADFFYILKADYNLLGKNHNYLVKYNSNSLAKEQDLKIEIEEIDNQKAVLEDVFIIKGKPHVFLSTFTKEKSLITWYSRVWNEEQGILEEAALLDTITIKENKPGNNYGIKHFVKAEKLLLFYSSPFQKGQSAFFSYSVLDDSLGKVWKKNLSFPYDGVALTVNKYEVDNEGNLFLLTSFSNEKVKGRNSALPQNTYSLWSYFFTKNELKETAVALGGKFVTSVTFQLVKDEQLAIGGFYSENKWFSIAGTFYLLLNKEDKAVVAKSLKGFSEEFLAEFEQERRSRSEKELPSFYFDHFIVEDDGSAYFVAEQFKREVSTYTDVRTGNVTSSTAYVYGDILVVHIGTTGKIEWSVRVPKSQFSTNDKGYYSSYGLGKKGDDLYLFYNDEEDNEAFWSGKGKLKIMDNPRKATTVYARINRSGEIAYRPLFKNKKNNIILKPDLSFDSENGFVFLTRKGNVYQFGKIRI